MAARDTRAPGAGHARGHPGDDRVPRARLGGLDVLTSDLGLAALRRGDGYVLPMTLWPLWGAALGLATYAYAVRRRGTCPPAR